jgi:hypothetical protein
MVGIDIYAKDIRFTVIALWVAQMVEGVFCSRRFEIMAIFFLCSF